MWFTQRLKNDAISRELRGDVRSVFWGAVGKEDSDEGWGSGVGHSH